MRRVAYCAAGTVVAFPISDTTYDRHVLANRHPAPEDIGGPCAVLRAATAAVKGGAAPHSGPGELEAACRIWRFFNESGGFSDDIAVVDHVGDGKSIEFAPFAQAACGIAVPSCPCLHGATMAELLPAEAARPFACSAPRRQGDVAQDVLFHLDL